MKFENSFIRDAVPTLSTKLNGINEIMHQFSLNENCVDPVSDRIASSHDRIELLVQSSIGKHQPTIDRKKIRVELDLEPVNAGEKLAGVWQEVVDELIRVAVHATPMGGDVSVTLVESPFQWELEVADSSPNPSLIWFHDSGRPRGAALVRAIPMLRGELEKLIERAQRLGGSIQSWSCPQGGTANVLSVPRRQVRRAA